MKPVPARKRQTKGEVTRSAILIAAERRFAECGFDGARLEMIADDVGIRQAAIFYYFPSKRVLFDELNAAIHSDLLDFTQRRLAGATDPWERLMLLVEAWLDFMVARPTAARIILRSCANASVNDQYPESYSLETLGILREILHEGVVSGRFANVDSMYLVNLLSSSILHYVCNAEQLANERSYRPEDPIEVGAFKAILRKTARAVLELEDRALSG